MSDTNLHRDSRFAPEEVVTNGGNSVAADGKSEEQRPGSEAEAPSPSAERSSQPIGTTAQLQPENGRPGGNEGVGSGSSQPIAFVSDPEGLQRKWDSVQVGFVDDPRNAVREADALVSATIEELAVGFNDQRSRLEAAWDRGSDASTDDLRGAFRTYRDFFERLLRV